MLWSRARNFHAGGSMRGGMTWSEADLLANLARGDCRIKDDGGLNLAARAKVALTDVPHAPQEPFVAMVNVPEDRYKSKTERRFAQLLDVWQYDGKVKRWWYEGLKLRLGDTCFFTPDFLVMPKEGER